MDSFWNRNELAILATVGALALVVLLIDLFIWRM